NSDEPPSPSPETEAPEEVQKVTFTDLDSVPWARDAIEFLATHRGILGLGDGLFGPNEPLTRAQFARFTAAALEITRSATATESTFSDVKPGDWFFEDVTALAELNILTGYPDGTFKPDETVTREQMAVILLRTLNSQGFPLTPVRPFTLVDDIADASDYAQNAIRSLYRAGLIEGVGGANYAPKSGSTRAQACVLLYRAILIVTNQPL
ncbi:MAG: S-layer homology domain-containing protein, partial [Oscillospiraceae bacterium]|nr:S-layer homology domain-containing protein [Oscillospiraceae bacterium]